MKSEFLDKLNESAASGRLTPDVRLQMEQFYTSYADVMERQGREISEIHPLFFQYLELAEEQIANPHHFEPFHKMIRKPVDYYTFGVEIMGKGIDYSACTRTGLDNLDRIEKQLAAGENVILLANHQTEPDPQVISILLSETHPDFARELLVVAGGRVLVDPMAMPFSLGRHLLCVYSKKHIANPPEKRAEKQAHNAATMRAMMHLLTEGGHAIYVAPSGGRDRPDEHGIIHPDRFDSSSVEIFRLIAARSGKPCHFYPLALGSHHLLPPPAELGEDVGEPRFTHGGGAHIAFGEEIDINNIPGSEGTDRQQRRDALANHAWNLVNELYQKFPEEARRA